MYNEMMKNKLYIFKSPLFITFILLIMILVTIIKIASVKVDKIPGDPVAVLPAINVVQGKKHGSYNSNPPTSGWYSFSSIRDGILTNPLKDEQIVEALTEGKVVINYNCQYKSTVQPTTPPLNPSPVARESPKLNNQGTLDPRSQRQTLQEANTIWEQVSIQNKACGDTIANLRKLVEKKGTKDLIMSPNNKLDSRIAIVSWGRIKKMLWFEEKEISEFIDYFRGRKPDIKLKFNQ